MAINEEIVTDRKYRRIKSVDPNLWERISFWTMASDVEMEDGTTLQDKVDTLESTINAGTAEQEHVLDGYTFTSAVGVNLTGNMTNRGTYNITLSSSNTATIPNGYHSGSGVVNAADRYTAGYNAGNAAGVAATLVGTATSARVLSGYTFTNASNSGLSGNMTNNGNWSYNMSSNTVTVPQGYHGGGGVVNAAARYTAGYNAGTDDATVTITTISNTQASTGATSLTFNAASISGYSSLTSANFAIKSFNIQIGATYYSMALNAYTLSSSETLSVSISYNASSGVATLSNTYYFLTESGDTDLSETHRASASYYICNVTLACFHT